MWQTVLHLRFPFVYVLAPIFVWGVAWGPGGWTARTTLGFLLVHLALYPGSNAYNSAIDRDTGPIGGLARPPAVPDGLRRWSVWLQAAGAALAVVVGNAFALAYAAVWAMSTAYSHPRTRWKRHPAASTAAVVVGQGGIGFLLGWTAAGPGGARAGLGAWDRADGWALLAACALVAALYPLTQIYQLDADRARRDRTLAAALGARGTFAWGAGCLALAAGALAALGSTRLAAFAAGSAAAATVAAARWPRGKAPSHRTVMRVAYVTSTVFLVALAVGLA